MLYCRKDAFRKESVPYFPAAGRVLGPQQFAEHPTDFGFTISADTAISAPSCSLTADGRRKAVANAERRSFSICDFRLNGTKAVQSLPACGGFKVTAFACCRLPVPCCLPSAACHGDLSRRSRRRSRKSKTKTGSPIPLCVLCVSAVKAVSFCRSPIPSLRSLRLCGEKLVHHGVD